VVTPLVVLYLVNQPSDSQGQPAGGSGPPGNALDFDGKDDYVEVPDDPSLDGMNGLTISMWIHPHTLRNYDVLISKGDWGDSYLAHLGRNGSVWFGRAVGDRARAPGIVTPNEWNHLALVFNGNSWIVYLNGKQKAKVSSSLSSIQSTTKDLLIGTTTSSNSLYDGKMDEVRIWQEARTQQEIQDLMHQEISNPSNKSNLVAYYDFNSSSGDTLIDRAGTNDGTLKNMTTTNGNNDWVASGAALTDASTKLTAGNTFSNDLAGIWPANSNATSGGLTLSENQNNSLAARENVIIGHNNDTGRNTNPKSSDYNFSRVSASSLIAVAKRRWYVDENAAGKPVDLTVNTQGAGFGTFYSGYKSDYVLIKVNNGNPDTLLTSADSIVPNNTISFDSISVNGTYTIGKVNNNHNQGSGVNTAPPGNALDFDGSDDYVEVPGHPALDGMNGLTISMWIHPHTLSDYDVLIGKEQWGDSYFAHLGRNGSVWFGSDVGDRVRASGIVTPNEWNHLAMVFNGNSWIIYLNGRQKAKVSSSSSSIQSTSKDLMIGYNTSSNSYFDGKMDELRIWREARTQQDIRDLMHQEISNPTNKNNLVAYYQFNSSSGNILVDQTSNYINAYLKNMTTTNGNNDWVASGAPFTDASTKLTAGNPFSNDLAGIWRADTSATSGGLTVSENQNNSLTGQDNVVIGHNKATGQRTNPNNSNYNFSNVSASSLYAVANRQWFVDENAGGKQVDLTFNTKKAGISGFNTGNKDDQIA
jgi:hypothetical protein